jgi:uncharacterized membrane protein
MKLENIKVTKDAQRARNFIAALLRWGVVLSALVTTVGGIGFLWQHAGQQVPDYSMYKGTLLAYRTIHKVTDGVMMADWLSVIQVGVLMLIATPVARILFSLITFIKEKDFAFIAITILVLAIVFFSMMGGFAA